MNKCSVKWLTVGRIVVFLLVCSFAVFWAYADDAPLEMKTIGGSEFLAGNSNTAVRLDSELVVITLSSDNYTVDATFWLFNEGGESTIEIGFPKEYKYYYNAESDIWREGRDKKGQFDINIIKKRQEFVKFETWVNKKKVKYVSSNGLVSFTFPSNDGILDYQITKQEKDGLEQWMYKNAVEIREKDNWEIGDTLKHTITTTDGKSFSFSFTDLCNKLTTSELDWLVKKVTLPAGTATMTRVRYVSKYPSSYYDPIWKYIYGTGKNWKDNIKKAVFIINDKIGITKKINVGVLKNNQASADRKPVISKKSNGVTEIIIYNLEPEDTEFIEGQLAE